MKKTDYILVIDSGNGGEYTLSKIRDVLPNENYIMFKDVINAPYGNKSKKELLNITLKNIKNISTKYDVKLVLFACNTLSSIVLNEVRNKIDDIFIMGILPDIKGAMESGKKSLILTTYATLKIGKINKMYKADKNLKFIGFKKLAKMIDENKENLDVLLPFLRKKLKKYKKVENVVLGCTHFNLIKNQLKLVLNNEITFFENSEKVAINLKEILKSLSLLNKQKGEGKVININN